MRDDGSDVHGMWRRGVPHTQTQCTVFAVHRVRHGQSAAAATIRHTLQQQQQQQQFRVLAQLIIICYCYYHYALQECTLALRVSVQYKYARGSCAVRRLLLSLAARPPFALRAAAACRLRVLRAVPKRYYKYSNYFSATRERARARALTSHTARVVVVNVFLCGVRKCARKCVASTPIEDRDNSTANLGQQHSTA